ncbi:MAG: 3-phosphoshikimate 1-carboxyvinyltransferase [Christensenellaceae bacterium]|jgi:3-phosphoshikimate 1-carboxyvinyltransferase
MDIIISPTSFNGSFTAPPSKSAAHRIIIFAALSKKPVSFPLAEISEDIDATINCLRALGASITWDSKILHITPIEQSTPAQSPLLDCKESGSTLRFLLPLAAILAQAPSFIGSGRLPARPILHILEAMASHGISASASKLPVTLRGMLTPGTYVLPGDVSSQYITGLLLSLPLLPADSKLMISTPLASGGYVALTLELLQLFGIEIHQAKNTFYIPGKQQYRAPQQLSIEGDWSNAAFFLSAGAINGKIRCHALATDSKQKDSLLLSILQKMGAIVVAKDDSLQVCADALHGISVNMSEIPDLLPILGVLGAAAEGKTVLYNAARTRIKESDRLYTTATMLRQLGVATEEKEDSLTIWGGNRFQSCSIDSFGDHRIAMAACIAAGFAAAPITVTNVTAINKSYPSFLNTFQTLGGNYREI